MYISLTILIFAVIASSYPAEHAKQIKNGIGLTPAMGFNNWNSGLREFVQFHLHQLFNPLTKLPQHHQRKQL
jgi:hypothetical protein